MVATNIDILFSDALMRRFALRALRRDRMYRIDRYDVHEEMPPGAPIKEILAYCGKNILRINRRIGTFYPKEGRLDRIYPPLTMVCFRALTMAMRPLLMPVTFPVWTISALSLRLRRRRPLFAGLKRFIRMQRRRGQAVSPGVSHVFLRVLSKYYLAIRAPFVIAWNGARVTAVGMRRRTVAAWRNAIFEFRRGRLHTNACGDFTLLARDRWFDLRGYAEFDAFSFHIDSLLCHAAVCSGLREYVFRGPERIYHIEHSAGSGFTPESQNKLWNRIDQSGIRRLKDDEFWGLAIDLRSGRRSNIFNDPDWGLEEHCLPETVIESET